MTIPVALVYFARHRRDLPFPWMFWLFGAFIVGCGLTHFMEVWTTYNPIYRFSALVKLATAAVSWATAVALVPLIPKALVLRGPRELEREVAERTEQLAQANEALQVELRQREQAQEALRLMTARLEQRVEERTIDLMQANALLQGEVQQREALIEQLEAKNAELERFTYTVSHDLKSPLVTIKGFLGMVERDALAGNGEALKDDIAEIATATNRMKRLLDDLLELSRIGRIANPSENVSLIDLAREVVQLLTGPITARGVRIEIDPRPVYVFGDQTRLREVLQNLVENAIKYLGNQQEPHVEIGVRQDGNETVYFVRDNGIGIEPQYQEKVFGLFEQLNPKSGGTGIGLALVKRTIEVHGGRIWVESEGLGKGATFCFTLPPGISHSPEREEHAGEAESTRSSAGGR